MTPWLQSLKWRLCPCPFHSHVSPTNKFNESHDFMILYIFSASWHFAYLSTFDLLVNEKIDLLFVSGGVVDAAWWRKPVPAGSTRLLVVTGQWFSQVPMSYKSAKNNDNINNSNLNSVLSSPQKQSASPDSRLVYSHSKTDGGYNNQDLPLHPFILDLCAIPGLQTFGVTSKSGCYMDTFVCLILQTTQRIKSRTCMIRLG